MTEHKEYFDELTCQLIQIGEYTGKLHSMLHTVTHYNSGKKFSFKKRIQQALFYPCTIAIISIIISFFMLIFISCDLLTCFKVRKSIYRFFPSGFFVFRHGYKKIYWSYFHS